MFTFLIFITYLLGALSLAAALLPILDFLLGFVADIRPDRLFYRSAMLIALIGLWPLLRWLNLRGRIAWGFQLDRPAFLRQLWYGWIAGVAILSGLLLIEWFAGIRLPAPDIPTQKLLSAIVAGLVGGLIIALIEETFFRGIMHHALRRRLSFLVTATLTASLYASLHFTRPPKLTADSPVTWDTGWQLFMGMANQYQYPLALVDSWLALFAVGIFLSLVRERTGNIALAMGLHAGWVLVIKAGKTATELQPDAPLAFLVGSYDNLIGWLAAGWITLLAWVYVRSTKPTPSTAAAKNNDD